MLSLIAVIEVEILSDCYRFCGDFLMFHEGFLVQIISHDGGKSVGGSIITLVISNQQHQIMMDCEEFNDASVLARQFIDSVKKCFAELVNGTNVEI